MNKYKLKMRTSTGLGNEYVYVYATSNFERYLNNHNLKYARDITKDYQLTDRFEDLQKQNTELKEQILLLKASEPMLEFAKQTYKDNWNKLKEWLEDGHKRSLQPYYECGLEYEDVLSKMQEIEGGMNE